MAVLTRDEIKALITANIVENGAWGVTPALVAEILTDIADSFAQLTDTAADVEVSSINITTPEDGVKVSGIKVVGAQQANIAKIEPVNTPIDTAVNAIIDALEAHGLTAVAV